MKKLTKKPIENIMPQNNKKSNSFEDIQLPQENFDNNNTKFYNILLTVIREKFKFALLKTEEF